MTSLHRIVVIAVFLGCAAVTILIFVTRRPADHGTSTAERTNPDSLPVRMQADRSKPGSAPDRPQGFPVTEAPPTGNGLEWPQREITKGDHALENNIRMHEEAARHMAVTDSEGAAALFEEKLRYEEDKFRTRSWRAQLKQSAREKGGTPDPEIYGRMLASIPDRYFSAIVDETLRAWPDSNLGEMALQEALRQEPQVQLPALATLIELESLSNTLRESAAQKLAPQLQMDVVPAALSDIDWSFAVSEHLRPQPANAGE